MEMDVKDPEESGPRSDLSALIDGIKLLIQMDTWDSSSQISAKDLVFDDFM